MVAGQQLEQLIERARLSQPVERLQPLGSSARQEFLSSEIYPDGYPALLRREVYLDVSVSTLLHMQTAEIVFAIDPRGVKKASWQGELIAQAATTLSRAVQGSMNTLCLLHTHINAGARPSQDYVVYVIVRLMVEETNPSSDEVIVDRFGFILDTFLDEAELFKAAQPIYDPQRAEMVRSWERRVMRSEESWVVARQDDSPLWRQPEVSECSAIPDEPDWRLPIDDASVIDQPSALAAGMSLGAQTHLPLRLYTMGVIAEHLARSPVYRLVKNDSHAFGEAVAFENEPSLSPLAAFCLLAGLMGL